MGGLWGSGAGRDRTKLGVYLDRNQITQGKLSKSSGVSLNTLTKLCCDSEYEGTDLTKRKVIAGLNKMGYDVDKYDLW
ncbi:hypothetical protein A9X05_09205 [Mycobacterium sp. E3298]|nr:hypothetical protein A9X05_09205 [Mycobacterium sp. E3298]